MVSSMRGVCYARREASRSCALFPQPLASKLKVLQRSIRAKENAWKEVASMVSAYT